MSVKGVKACGAKCRTKSGAPCLGWAMPNGRCRMHGGVSGTFKHGRCSNRARLRHKIARSLLLTMGDELHSLLDDSQVKKSKINLDT